MSACLPRFPRPLRGPRMGRHARSGRSARGAGARGWQRGRPRAERRLVPRARRPAGGRGTAYRGERAARTIGGCLGAHMAYAGGVGVSHPVFVKRIAEWTPLPRGPPSATAGPKRTFTGLRVLAQVGDGHPALVVSPPAPIVVSACGRSRVALSPLSRRRQPFHSDDGAVLEEPGTNPIPHSSRGLAETASKSDRPAQRADCSPDSGHQVPLESPGVMEASARSYSSRDDDDLSRSPGSRFASS